MNPTSVGVGLLVNVGLTDGMWVGVEGRDEGMRVGREGLEVGLRVGSPVTNARR